MQSSELLSCQQAECVMKKYGPPTLLATMKNNWLFLLFKPHSISLGRYCCPNLTDIKLRL